MRVCQFYAVGKSLQELLAYDEYCSGTGQYFTDNILMCNRYTSCEAKEVAWPNEDFSVYLVTIENKTVINEHKDKIEHTNYHSISLMWHWSDPDFQIKRKIKNES